MKMMVMMLAMHSMTMRRGDDGDDGNPKPKRDDKRNARRDDGDEERGSRPLPPYMQVLCQFIHLRRRRQTARAVSVHGFTVVARYRCRGRRRNVHGNGDLFRHQKPNYGFVRRVFDMDVAR